jgi:hypothetical protein
MTLIMFNTVIYLIASPVQMQRETIPEGMEKMKMPLQHNLVSCVVSFTNPFKTIERTVRQPP